MILHGTRSGRDWTTAEEFAATCRYVSGGAGGLGWHATISDNELAIHLPPHHYGWNARAASGRYLAVEFAQPTADRAISDAQVAAFVWWFALARVDWPDLPLVFPMHSELPEGIADGKSDVFPRGSYRAAELRDRIRAALGR